jgi:excisionase family DNA binding protein
MTRLQRPAGIPPAKAARYEAGLPRRTLMNAPDPQTASRKGAEKVNIPFADRITCNILEACEVTGLGRSKVYELISRGEIETRTVGRRRLVVVRSLLALFGSRRAEPAES